MNHVLKPWQLFLLILAGWINRHQQEVIEYLEAENRVLREKFGKRRILLNDDQRRRLAVKGKVLGRKALAGNRHPRNARYDPALASRVDRRQVELQHAAQKREASPCLPRSRRSCARDGPVKSVLGLYPPIRTASVSRLSILTTRGLENRD